MQELPNTIQKGIVLRFLKGKTMEDFTEQYHASKMRSNSKEPSDKQFDIADEVKRSGLKEAAKKHRVSEAVAQYCVYRVGTYYFLKGK